MSNIGDRLRADVTEIGALENAGTERDAALRDKATAEQLVQALRIDLEEAAETLEGVRIKAAQDLAERDAAIATLQLALAAAGGDDAPLLAEIVALKARIAELESEGHEEPPPDPDPEPTGDVVEIKTDAEWLAVNDKLMALPAGGTIRVWYKDALYPGNTITITASGQPGKPKRITGYDPDGQGRRPLFKGSRNNGPNQAVLTDPPTPMSVTSGATGFGSTGSPWMVFQPDVKHLVIEKLSVEKVSNAFTIATGNHDIVIQHNKLWNIRDGLYCNHATATAIKFLHNEGAFASKSLYRISGDSSDWEIGWNTFNMGRLDSDKFQMGGHCYDTAHDCWIHHNHITYSIETQSGNNAKYWNGDAYEDNRENYNMVYEDNYGGFCSDGIFDLKSFSPVLRRNTAEGGKTNYRFWSYGTVTFEGNVSINPAKTVVTARGYTGGTGAVSHVWQDGESDPNSSNVHILKASGNRFRSDAGFATDLLSRTADQQHKTSVVLASPDTNVYEGVAPNWS